MYGSYGSYSSLGSVSEPVGMATANLRTHDFATSVCAFPSWPRRSSLSSDDGSRPTSYLSDDDLFLSDPFDDDSASTGAASPFGGASPHHSSPSRARLEQQQLRDFDLEQEREREDRRMLAADAERRRSQRARMMQAMGKKRSSSAKKSPRPKVAMAPIAEALE